MGSTWLGGYGLCCGLALALAIGAQAQSTPQGQAGPLTGLVPDHVTISVADIERMSEWYVRVLGFKAPAGAGNDPSFQNLHLTIPGYRIDLIKYKGSARMPIPSPLYVQQGWIHIAFNVTDLAGALKQLESAKTDVTVGSKDSAGVPTRLIVHDPEGNEIEFFARK